MLSIEEKRLSNDFKLDQGYSELEDLTPLLYAAKHGLTPFIRLTLSKLTKEEVTQLLTQTNPGGLTALHFAARYGHVDAVDLLLKCEASRTMPSKLGSLPIHLIFSEKNNTETMECLFNLFMAQAPDCLSRKNNSGENIAHLAASFGAISILTYIATTKADLLIQKDNAAITPFCRAVLNNQIDAINFLLHLPGHDMTNSKGQNALHMAAQLSTPQTMTLLLNYFDINSLDNEGNSALHFVTEAGDHKKIQLIEENAAHRSSSQQP